MDARRKPPSPHQQTHSHRPSSSRSSLSDGGLDVIQLKAKVLSLSISVALGRCLKQSLRLGFSELRLGLEGKQWETSEKVNVMTTVLERVITERLPSDRSESPGYMEQTTPTVWIRGMARGLDRRKVRLEVRREHALLALARKRIQLALSTAWSLLKDNKSLESNLMVRLAFRGWKGKQRPEPSKAQLKALGRVCTRLRVRITGKLMATFHSLLEFTGHAVSNRVRFDSQPVAPGRIGKALSRVFARTSRRHGVIKKVYIRQWGECASMTASRRCRKQDFYSKIWFVLSTVARRMRFIAWNRLKKAQITRKSPMRYTAKAKVAPIACERLIESVDFLRKSAQKRAFFCLRFAYFREKRAKVTGSLLRRALLPSLFQTWKAIQRFSAFHSLYATACACLFQRFTRFRQRMSLEVWKTVGFGRKKERIEQGVRGMERTRGKIAARLKAETLANVIKVDPWAVSKRTAALKIAVLVKYRLKLKAKERIRYFLDRKWRKLNQQETLLSPCSSFETQRRVTHRLLTLSPVSVPSRASPNSTLDFAWAGEELDSIRSTLKKRRGSARRICFECGAVVRPNCQF